MAAPFASIGTCTQTRSCVAAILGLSRPLLVRIHQRHDRSDRDAFENRSAFAQRPHFHFLQLASPSTLAIPDLLSVVLEHRFCGKRHGLCKAIAKDAQLRLEARPQPRIYAVDLDGHVEFVLGIVVPEFASRGSSDRSHFPAERLTRKRIYLYIHGLSGLDIGAIGLADLRRNLQTRTVDHFGNRTARVYLVPNVVIRQGHPIHEESSGGIAVAVDDHEPIDRRGYLHVLYV